MAEQDVQRQLDIRALELASGVNAVVRLLEERMTRHELDCLEERRQATKQRHDFRAEMAHTLSSFRNETAGGLHAIQNRINAGLALVLVTLLGTTGFLFVKTMGWM